VADRAGVGRVAEGRADALTSFRGRARVEHAPRWIFRYLSGFGPSLFGVRRTLIVSPG
jgi:hypothetical protein